MENRILRVKFNFFKSMWSHQYGAVYVRQESKMSAREQKITSLFLRDSTFDIMEAFVAFILRIVLLPLTGNICPLFFDKLGQKVSFY